jgi:hypothetical protein
MVHTTISERSINSAGKSEKRIANDKGKPRGKELDSTRRVRNVGRSTGGDESTATLNDSVGENKIPSDYKIIETLTFQKGKDNLKIILMVKPNRTHGVKVFLNDTTEIRPTTYAGANPAFAFWNLLKRSLKS